MADVLHLPELPGAPDERWHDPEFMADLYADRLRFDASWPEILAMAVRDGAASVHFHPWRTNAVCDDLLSYVVGGVQYGLLPPDPESGRRLVADARRLAAPGPAARLRAWAAGGAVGRVRLVAGRDESEWCVVCWGAGATGGCRVPAAPPDTGYLTGGRSGGRTPRVAPDRRPAT
jgi:hypothetical protein